MRLLIASFPALALALILALCAEKSLAESANREPDTLPQVTAIFRAMELKNSAKNGQQKLNNPRH